MPGHRNTLRIFLALIAALLAAWPGTANAHMGVRHEVLPAINARLMSARLLFLSTFVETTSLTQDVQALAVPKRAVSKGAIDLRSGQVVVTASPADTSSCHVCCTDDNCAGCAGCCWSTECMTSCSVCHNGLATAFIGMSMLQLGKRSLYQLDHELVGFTHPPEPEPPRS